jgi:hypothetical protein
MANNVFNYSILTLSELISKIEKSRFWDLPKMVAEALKKIQSTPSYSTPYKVYSALLTQSGTDAPTAIILENTLGEIPIWTRVNRGNFRLTSPNSTFDKEKTITMITPQIGDYELSVDTINETPIEIRINQIDRTTSLGADELDHLSIEIRVYN